ncbi:translation initiation factor IF-2 subunit gamma [ANME-1 cluster archaeon ex4572_4]|nr:MAG: translation initiation factor IF-2 subunit gamma [ANME-1 cluster archaeon ex4572_4]PXF51015.1 MAG: translation initiation factor IF-2 subunit gamma [Methanophagales archaeon]HDN68144.1 translation initiation factor IF-2 subunit gamma [Methanomicrobia archaeon]
MVGHVDHGKTTLVRALSGEWADRHSEEIKRGISIRLGYADVTFRKCPACEEPGCYTVEEFCKHCGSRTEELRSVSFVDSPGHEALMATMLSGAAIMDGAVLLIAASEPCPQPQTKEHLMALNLIGIKKIVIAQNKIDLVSRAEALQHYRQIKEFVRGTGAENSPIVPISAQQSANLDILIQCIEQEIPTPSRPADKPPIMHIARSFDVNKPGTPIKNLKGGVIGGSLLQGRLREGDRLEIRPGRVATAGGKEAGGKEKETWQPIETEISSIIAGGERVKEVTPGGLIGVGTKLDPSLTIEDSLVGQCVGTLGSLPPTRNELRIEFHLLDRVVGVAKEEGIQAIKLGEKVMLSVGTAITMGEVKRVTKARETVDVKLSRPICAENGARVAIGRKIGARWHLIGSGRIL